MVVLSHQSPWFKLMAYHLIFQLMIQVTESYRGNFGSPSLEGQEVYSLKLQWFKVDKRNMLLGMSSPTF